MSTQLANRIVLGSVLMIAGFTGCGATAPPEATTTKPIIPERPRSARDKRRIEQLEVDRQMAELDRQRLEKELELKSQETEIEKQKLVRSEAENARRRQEEVAKTFTSDEFAETRKLIREQFQSLGKLLLDRTHPTGTYSYTDMPSVALSPQKDTVTTSIAVHWKGALSENKYETTYSFRLTKKGLDRLQVLRDTPIFQINPQNLKAAEADLRDMFDTN